MSINKRAALIATARQLDAEKLNRGTAGNVSVRTIENNTPGLFITPTGMPAAMLIETDIVFLDMDGTPQGANTRAPSSEWRFHRDLYAARPEFNAVVHTHAPFATSLACARQDIPPFHYMIARFGGANIRCARYATFGTQELSENALDAMRGRNACLLANHGMLVAGASLDQALALAVELETLCEQYWRVLQLGEPVLLDQTEMQKVLEKFRTYGQQQKQ